MNANCGDNIIYHDYVDISIAILRHLGLWFRRYIMWNHYNFMRREKIKNLADKARNGKLSLEEMKGGTFTINNGGVLAL